MAPRRVAFVPTPVRASTRPPPASITSAKPPHSSFASAQIYRVSSPKRPHLLSVPTAYRPCVPLPTALHTPLLTRQLCAHTFGTSSKAAFFGHPLAKSHSRNRFSLAGMKRISPCAVAKGGGGGEDTPQGGEPAAELVAGSSVAIDAPETVGEGRPDWAPDWLPDFFVDLRKRPLLQLAILLPLYAVHLFFFSTKGWKFRKTVIPNEKNLFGSIGYDSVVGAVVALVFLVWRKMFVKRKEGEEPEKLLPNLLKVDNPPWKVPREAKKRIGQTAVLLMVAYLASGYGAVFSEQILFLLAGSGVPLTTATTRAWKVLSGHLMWVYMGIRILRRLKPFFPPKGTWMQWKWKSNWVWWAIGGYYVSALFFNMADVLNQLVLPASMFEEETVVSKLINPENKDRIAMAVGSIGPCVSAPVFEEVLYRGFLLPALACFFPMWVAIPASSILFALHHLNPTMVLPLAMLGLIWAIIYSKSRNLTVTILIHAMWNSRVFLGSLLGLGTFTDFE